MQVAVVGTLDVACYALNICITLNVRAVFELIKHSSLLVRKIDVYGNVHRAACRNKESVGTCFGSPVDEQVCVICCNASVAVKIGSDSICNSLGSVAGNVVKYRLSVVVIGIAVIIDVMALNARSYAVPDIGYTAAREHLCFMGYELAVYSLCEQIGQQRELKIHRGRVVNSKVIAVNTGFCGIVAKLDLYLAVSGSTRKGCEVIILCTHHYDSRGVYGPAYVYKSRALLQYRSIAAVGLHDGCRGHEQALYYLTGSIVVAQIDILCRHGILSEILGYNCGKTRDMRSRHGCSAHYLILIRAARNSSVGKHMSTGNGVDRTAGSGYFRLHQQRAGCAPRAEVRNIGFLTGYKASVNGYIRYLNDARIVCIVADGMNR